MALDDDDDWVPLDDDDVAREERMGGGVSLADLEDADVYGYDVDHDEDFDPWYYHRYERPAWEELEARARGTRAPASPRRAPRHLLVPDRARSTVRPQQSRRAFKCRQWRGHARTAAQRAWCAARARPDRGGRTTFITPWALAAGSAPGSTPHADPRPCAASTVARRAWL